MGMLPISVGKVRKSTSHQANSQELEYVRNQYQYYFTDWSAKPPKVAICISYFNGTNSQDDLNSIQAEIQQRLSEIDRISEQTDFNGVKVLSSDQELKIQVGANDGEAINVNLREITSETLSLGAFNINGFDASELTAYADGDFVGVNAADVNITDTAGDLSNIQFQQDNQGNWFITGELDGRSVAIAESDLVINYDDSTPGSETLGITFDSSAATILEVRSQDPLAALDQALSQVDTLRSDLGAIQNRFESAITNLQTNATNLSAARSRIEDADYAVEVANMTRAQILQQAGTSVLAQANQVPQSVLSLLG